MGPCCAMCVRWVCTWVRIVSSTEQKTTFSPDIFQRGKSKQIKSFSSWPNHLSKFFLPCDSIYCNLQQVSHVYQNRHKIFPFASLFLFVILDQYKTCDLGFPSLVNCVLWSQENMINILNLVTIPPQWKFCVWPLFTMIGKFAPYITHWSNFKARNMITFASYFALLKFVCKCLTIVDTFCTHFTPCKTVGCQQCQFVKTL